MVLGLVSGNVSQRSKTTVGSARRILRTWGTCATCVTWEARRPRMGCPPMRGWGGAANLGWEPVHQRREGERASEGRVSRMRDVRDRLGALLDWHRRLRHPSIKTVVALTESGAIGMVITVLMRALHVSQPKRYTSHIRKGTVAQANTWVEFTLTSPGQRR